MRRGGLAQALQHAWDPSPFIKPNLCSPRSAALSFLAVSHHHHRRRDYNNPNNSGRLSASIASLSFSTVSGDFSAASFRGPALNFDEYHSGRRFSSECSPLINLNSRRIVKKISSRELIWGSTRSCLHSCGRIGGPQQGSASHPKLVRMAASAAKNGGAPDGYRPNVGLCLVNEKDEVFVASRLDIRDSWQMPQGGVDEGEDPQNAAVRELREETGVTKVQLIGEVPEWLTYDFPPDVKTKIAGLWGKEWNGQAQKWFLFRFTGEDSEINLEGDGSEKPEFGEWKWLPAEEVLRRAVEFKKPVYVRAFKSLSIYIDSWSKL